MSNAKNNSNRIGFTHDRTHGKEQYMTPPEILAALGKFDLDPCYDLPHPYETAKNYFTSAQNGLAQKWNGRVWLNPPYGSKTAQWMKKMAMHRGEIGGGIALIFVRTEPKTFFPWVWDYASAFLFIKGRVAFHTPDGKAMKNSAGAPSMLIAYSDLDADMLQRAAASGKIPGKFLINEGERGE